MLNRFLLVLCLVLLTSRSQAKWIPSSGGDSTRLISLPAWKLWIVIDEANKVPVLDSLATAWKEAALSANSTVTEKNKVIDSQASAIKVRDQAIKVQEDRIMNQAA